MINECIIKYNNEITTDFHKFLHKNTIQNLSTLLEIEQQQTNTKIK